MRAHTHIHTQLDTYTDADRLTHRDKYALIDTDTHTHTHTYTHACIETHTHTNTTKHALLRTHVHAVTRT